MPMKQFEIWIADLNPRMGTEAGKVRPVVIVQTNLLNNVHPSTLVCPVTTDVIPQSAILRVHLRKAKSGLRQDSDIMIDQLRAIDNRRLVKKVGVVDAATTRKVRDSLRIVLDLD
jgi:mRNA interferase MazF